MNIIHTDQEYNREEISHYKDDYYSVRDNGAILRHPRENGRKRQLDNKWTFGKPNKRTGYMEIASKRVHRIVAYAFHGDPPTDKHVVDHIDTNKQNNRPENLRWVTRFENIILNPITAKRISLVCGSVEAFLEDPSKYRDNFPEPNLSWMCTVSKAQAQASRENLINWATSDKTFAGGSLGEWVMYREITANQDEIEEIFKQIELKTGINRQQLCHNKLKRNKFYEARKYAAKQLRSKLSMSDYQIGKILGISATTVNLYLEVTSDWYSQDHAEVRDKQFRIKSEKSDIIPKNIIQRNWGTESEYPSCPQSTGDNPISEYATGLDENSLFFRNQYYFTLVIKHQIIDSGKSLLVLYSIERDQDQNDRWGIMKITFENDKYIHEIIPNYNRTLEHYWLIDAENHFNSIVEGLQWVPLYDSQGREFGGDYMPL